MIGSYQYNGQGVRVWRTITYPVIGQVATVYDPTGTGNLYGEYFAADYREYVYLDGIPVASATDAGRQAPSMTYLYADQLGTVRAATTTAGTTSYQWPWLNNAFGELPPSGAAAYYTRFPGQYYDVETGLMYNGARYYDTLSGRYLQPDPMGQAAGPSLYAYTGDDPLGHTDPLGLFLYPLERPIKIYGATSYAQEKAVQDAIDQVLSTPRGQEMLEKIEGPWYEHGTPQSLYISDYGDIDSLAGEGVLFINPNANVWIQTSNEKIVATISRMIAHELGHSLMGDHDDGKCSMNNINKNENPIMKALGQPLRTAY
jgi:RHS repeat-associated protein